MELGISPIVTASMVLQLLAGSKVIQIDQNSKEDQALFNGAQKVLAIMVAMFEAVAYVWTGMYGDLEQVGAGNAILIVV
jgi:protein transport protein SEC61 subunit alpha